MSAIFENIESWESDWISQDTQATDLPSGGILDPTPAPSNWPERSDGISVGGILQGVSATADSLSNIFGKVYNLQNSAANQKFQQEVTRATLDVQKAQVLGGLELQRSKDAANNRVELARAQLEVQNAQARLNSPGAMRVGSASIPQSWVLLGVAAAAFFFYKKGGSK